MAKQQLKIIPIERTAIDSSGHLGSFYDGYRDGVSGELDSNKKERSSELLKTAKCVVKNGNKDNSINLLQLINMTEDLRLSILSGLVKKSGIASIIDYPYPVNESTRILYYSYVYRKERLSDEVIKTRKFTKSNTPTTAITHIITDVSYGMDVVVVLQLPSENNINQRIDDALQAICTCIKDDHNVSMLNAEHEKLLETINDIIVYSNISDLMSLTKLRDVCFYINENKNKAINTPIMYTLRPITWLFPDYTGFGTKLVAIPSTLNNKVEQYLVQLSNRIKSLKHSLDFDVTSLLCGHLEEQLRDTQRQWQNLTKMQEDVIKRLGKLIFVIRCGRVDASKIDQTLNHNDQMKLKVSIEKLKKNKDSLEAKGQLITNLRNQHFECFNVADFNVNNKHYQETLKRRLTRNDHENRILCSNDTLNSKNEKKLNKLREQLVEERDTSSDLCLIYADFSYCSVELPEMIILSSSKKDNNKNINKQNLSSPSRKTMISASSLSPSPLPTDKIINILLLGESGVGKSTFINAFVNYLTFKTFEQAQSTEPVVLIPVSFLMTIGNNFEERIVNFGGLDSSNNEDFDHPGQSVTQYCKSHVFHFNDNSGRELHIIDTPGFGDTRGLDQDDINMQHILEYINNLTHLNAVCFLLKPNASQLHTFFRMCFTQLLDLLGPNVHQNIIFCFTNARSTFYTPGNTAPLLKIMLKSSAMNDIPFKKENTFCFDNESFRYLAALQNSITFDNEEKHEYEMSWSFSVNESSRLLNYICTQLNECRVRNEWKSIKHAQVEIIHIMRPMLETMRNILRNFVLCKMDFPNKSIKLCPKAIHRPATICHSCKSYPVQVGNFWILRDIPHEFLKICLVCPCSPDKHIPIKYVLNYEYLNSPMSDQQSKMINMAYQLCHAGAEFDYFLMHVVCSSNNSPFSIGLVRMIIEENELCHDQKPNRLNLQLVKYLTELECEYKERIEEMKSKQQQTALPIIYKWITTIHEYPMIQEQLEAIKQTQITMTEPYEVPED